MTTRRAFLSLLAAPAIVSAANLMPIKMYLPRFHLDGVHDDHEAFTTLMVGNPVLFRGGRFTPTTTGPLVIPFEGTALIGKNITLTRDLKTSANLTLAFPTHQITGLCVGSVPQNTGPSTQRRFII